MSTETRLDLGPNLAMGICIAVVGVALTLDTLRILEAERILRYWPLGLVLLGASVVVQSFFPRAEGRPRPSGVPGFVLTIIILGFLFGPAYARRNTFVRSGSQTSDTVSLFAVMGKDQRTSYATQFKGGDMTSFMGGTELDLRRATIAPGEEAVVDVFAMMGGVILRVPDSWEVDVRTMPVMGGVSDQRFGRRGFIVRPRPGAPAPPAEAAAPTPEAEKLQPTDTTTGPRSRLVVRGFIMMGGLVIKP